MSAKGNQAVAIYLASAGTSMFGNAVANIVWPWLVLERTGDPAAAGLVATCIALPAIAVAVLGGHLIDSVGRQRMSIISDIISGLSVIALIMVDQSLGLDLWWFIAIGILGAVGDVPGMAARAALVGDVSVTSGMSVEKISGANQSVMGVMFLLGPAVAGFLMQVLPIEAVLWITAACSLLAAALTAMLRLRARSADPTADQLSGVRAWRAVLGSAPVRLLVVVMFVSTALISPYLSVLLPAHFQKVAQPALLGISLSAYAVGMIAGGGLVAVVGAAYRRRLWTTSMLLITGGFLGLGFLQHTAAVLIGMVLGGLSIGLIGPLQMVLVTENIAESVRGRAFSLFSAINLFAAPIGLSLATLFLARASIYQVAAVIAALWVLAGGWALLRGLQVLPRYVALEDPVPAE
ncbi:MFS transporter [Corynebacterium sp. H127]|uniref:MFS transporter n=1 Tax=Corynebacterium sp. H127 TaxID=3133418 RepID=UPI0030A22C9D